MPERRGSADVRHANGRQFALDGVAPRRPACTAGASVEDTDPGIEHPVEISVDTAQAGGGTVMPQCRVVRAPTRSP
jgi:hypothetical protein